MEENNIMDALNMAYLICKAKKSIGAKDACERACKSLGVEDKDDILEDALIETLLGFESERAESVDPQFELDKFKEAIVCEKDGKEIDIYGHPCNATKVVKVIETHLLRRCW